MKFIVAATLLTLTTLASAAKYKGIDQNGRECRFEIENSIYRVTYFTGTYTTTVGQYLVDNGGCRRFKLNDVTSNDVRHVNTDVHCGDNTDWMEFKAKRDLLINYNGLIASSIQYNQSAVYKERINMIQQPQNPSIIQSIGHEIKVLKATFGIREKYESNIDLTCSFN